MNSAIAINKLTGVASAGSAILKRTAEPMWRTLTFSLADERIYPARTLCASLEKGVLSVAYGTRFLSRIRIQGARRYSSEEGKYPQPEFFASSLALAINDLGAAKTNVTLSIPKAWAIITTADFPATVRDNLSDVITYELDRITPFGSEDAFYDFKVLGENDEKLSVLVAAAKAELIRPYIDALKENGITVNRIGVNLSAFETLCRHSYGKAGRVFVEVSGEEYEGALFLDGSITGAFSGRFSGEDDKSRVDAVMSEITPLCDAIKGLGKEPKITALLKGENNDLLKLLSERMGNSVEILNNADMKVGLSGNDKSIPYAAVGGVLESLWLKAQGLDLSSKGRHETLRSPKVLTIILGAMILAMWALYFISPLKIEEKRLQEIDRQISLRKGEVKKVETLKKEVESMDKEIATINEFKEGPMALDVLKELTSILPKNTWLSRVRIGRTNVDLEGYASSATGLLPKLEASQYFKKAEFASPTFRDTRMNSDRFNIKMELKGATKDETKAKAGTDEGQEE